MSETEKNLAALLKEFNVELESYDITNEDQRVERGRAIEDFLSQNAQYKTYDRVLIDSSWAETVELSVTAVKYEEENIHYYFSDGSVLSQTQLDEDGYTIQKV